MRFARLTTTLKALDKPALKRLHEYLHSPYFKTPPTATALFTYLQAQKQPYTTESVSPENIARHQPLLDTENKQAIAATQLLKAVEGFMTIENLYRHPYNHTWHLLDEYKNLHLAEGFEKTYEAAMQQIEECPEQNTDTFFHRQMFIALSFSGFLPHLNRTTNNDLTPLLKSFDEFYALKKLRYICEALNRKKNFGIPYTEETTGHLLQILEPYNSKKYPYVYLTINIYGLISANSYEEGLPYYVRIKEFAAEQGDTLPESIAGSISWATGWCITWGANGYENIEREYLWWIELRIKHNLLLQNGKITPILFRNTVNLAVLHGYSPDWIKQFINRYEPCLPPQHRDTTLAYSQGLYHYAVKEHKTAGRFLQQAQAGEEVPFNAVIRRIKWINDYEDNPAETELLLRQLEAFEKYIDRNDEGFHRYKKGFALFVTYARKLLNATGKKERQTLLAALRQEPFFAFKPWLIEQLEN